MDEWTLNDLLECSVCLDRLDTSSKVLPCQHTFCKKCLLDIYEAHKELRCPECRVLIECTIDELPCNVLLMRILESINHSGKKPAAAKPVAAPHHVSEPRHHHRHQHTSNPATKPETTAKEHVILSCQPCARALYSYSSPEAGDLNFKKGDLILLKKKVDANWFHGECNGNKGVFPSVYVEVINPLPSPVPQCKALYDFKMNSEEEEGCLAFKKGEIITVIRRVDENWAEGRLSHKIGIFPLAFVEMNHVARNLMKLSSNAHPGPSKVAPPTPTSEETTPLIPISSELKTHHLVERLEPSSSSQSSASPNSSTSTSTPSSTSPSSPASPPLQEKPPPPNPRSTASASHAPHKEKRHSLNLLHPANPTRHLADPSGIDANSSGEKHHGSSRNHRHHKRSISDHQGSVQLPAVYVAMYPYKPQKADELELKKGVVYIVTEKCQDGWFRGTSQVTNKSGVFPGNYVALPKNHASPANSSRGQAQGSPGWGRAQPTQPNVNKASTNPDRPYLEIAKHVLAAAHAAVQNVASSQPNATPTKSTHVQSNLCAPPELPPRSVSPNSILAASSISSAWRAQGPESMITVTALPRGQNASQLVSTSVSASPVVSLAPQGHSSAEKAKDKKSLGSGLIRRLATIKNSKSPPPSTYSMDNPVFDDGSLSGTDLVTATPAVAALAPSATPVHTRSGSCPSQLLQQTPDCYKSKQHFSQSAGSQRIKHKDPRSSMPNPFVANRSNPASADPAMTSNHRKSNSLDASSAEHGKKNRALFPPVKERFRCIVPYPPNSEHELALEMGDVIYVHKKRDDGWYKGTQERTGRTGLFPASFVEAL
ncbi:E3 ubiquitin-protein ligase SH3RF1-like isoform X1 [Cloeon dipterum]|uniref:E3 ubiquitin-protein ligase SH3RF1-like isoform X1 n=1 Tax=Cloeon dipterum TaxID=197152 RepID=UPI00321FFEB5